MATRHGSAPVDQSNVSPPARPSAFGGESPRDRWNFGGKTSSHEIEGQKETVAQKQGSSRKRIRGRSDTIEQLSRQYARRRAARSGDKPARKITLPLSKEIYQPLVAMSQEHQDTCLVFIDDRMPPMTLPDADGKGHALLDSLGEKLTVVIFWAAENPYALDQFEEMGRELMPLADQGVQIVAIHVGPEPDDYAQLAEKYGAGAVCLFDTDESYFRKVAKARLPRTYVLDAQGKIIWLDIEYSRTTRHDLRNALHFYLQN
jgi:peroxiredoxin